MLAMALAIVGIVVAGDLFFWAGHALSSRTIRVTGRVVDAAGTPVAGARVLTLPSEKWRDDPRMVAVCRRQVADMEAWVAEGNEAEPLLLTAGGVTGPDGSFDLRLYVTHCERMGVLVPLFCRERTRPYAGTHTLLVEDRAVDCATGTWTEHGGDGVFATLDMGRVTVD